jgi:hypothetical protein
MFLGPYNPGLTPWAKLCRPYGAQTKQMKGDRVGAAYPGLPAWARLCRPFGADDWVVRDFGLERHRAKAEEFRIAACACGRGGKACPPAGSGAQPKQLRECVFLLCTQGLRPGLPDKTRRDANVAKLCRPSGARTKQMKGDRVEAAYPGLPAWARLCRPSGADH